MCAIVARVGQRVCCRNKFWDVIKKVCDILRFIKAMQLTPHIFARQLNNSQVSITNREVGWWIYKRTIHHTLCETVDVKNYISFKWFRWKNWSLVVPLIWLSEFFSGSESDRKIGFVFRDDFHADSFLAFFVLCNSLHFTS